MDTDGAVGRCEALVIQCAEEFRDCHRRGDSASILTHVNRLNAAVDLLREARIRNARYAETFDERYQPATRAPHVPGEGPRA